jgi:hypothetical protein
VWRSNNSLPFFFFFFFFFFFLFFFSGGFNFRFLTHVREFEFELDFFFFSQLLCHVNILYYFNKIVSLVSIFHQLLNDNDYFDTIMKD